MRFPTSFPTVFLEDISKDSAPISLCAVCKTNSDGKSLCPQHLALARANWHSWTRARNAKGLCWQCHRKRFRGQQRCRTHTRLNQERCRIWMKENRPMLLRRYRDRVLAGVCAASSNHGPAVKPHVYCLDCRARQKVERKNRRLTESRRR